MPATKVKITRTIPAKDAGTDEDVVQRAEVFSTSVQRHLDVGWKVDESDGDAVQGATEPTGTGEPTGEEIEAKAQADVAAAEQQLAQAEGGSGGEAGTGNKRAR